MKVRSTINSTCFKIYIDDILHLRLPIDREYKLQSWIADSSNQFKIEVSCCGHVELLEYESRELWETILREFDKKY